MIKLQLELEDEAKLEDLEPLSVEKRLYLKESIHFLNDINKSIDLLNNFQNQSKCENAECNKSVDLLNSFRSVFKQPERKVSQNENLVSMINCYNQSDKPQLEQRGIQPIDIKQVESEEEDIQPQNAGVFVPDKSKIEFNLDEIKQYLTKSMAKMLDTNDLPIQYLQGMLNLQNQFKFKTARRLKVERYLMKRRLKTWDRKVCYNCRQKVAEERLRVKGRFVARKKVIEILGVKQRKNNQELKALLQERQNHV